MMQLRTRIGLMVVGADFWAFVSKRERRMEELEAELDRAELKSIRGVRDLVQTFHKHLECGTDEDSLRDGLSNALVDLNDHVARLEEHSST
jgi:hypothetical protein